MKKVSILIPLYNSENFIKETIECCLKVSIRRNAPFTL